MTYEKSVSIVPPASFPITTVQSPPLDGVAPTSAIYFSFDDARN